MFFIHEIDLTQRIYREIITCDPYIALFHAGRSYTNRRYKVLVRETENFYDIFDKKERDLTFVFYHVTHEVKACVLKKRELGPDVNLHAVFAELVENYWPAPQETYMSNDVKMGRRKQGTLMQFHIDTSENPPKNRFGLTRFEAFVSFNDAVLVLGAHSPFNTPAEFMVNLNEVKENQFHLFDLKYFTKRYPR